MRMATMGQTIVLQALCAQCGVALFVWQPLSASVLSELKSNTVLHPYAFHPVSGRMKVSSI